MTGVPGGTFMEGTAVETASADIDPDGGAGAGSDEGPGASGTETDGGRAADAIGVEAGPWLGSEAGGRTVAGMAEWVFGGKSAVRDGRPLVSEARPNPAWLPEAGTTAESLAPAWESWGLCATTSVAARRANSMVLHDERRGGGEDKGGHRG